MAANKLLETINAAAEAPDAELSIPERMALLQAVEKLRGAYETSMDIAIRVMLAVCPFSHLCPILPTPTKKDEEEEEEGLGEEEEEEERRGGYG